MAIYRFETRNIGRGDSAIGRSVVASAAYRAGEKLKDDRYQASHDYSRRTQGIAHTQIVAPGNAPAFASDRESLWNAVEKSEKRKDSRLAREFIIALPCELTAGQRRDLIVGFASDELVKRGMVVDLSIHEPKSGLNHHAHLLCTTRRIDASGFGLKEREWNKDESLEGWREAWEIHCNDALEKAGLDVRVSRLSLEERGIEQVPEPKIGVIAAALEKKGIETARGQAVREVHYDNSMQAAIRDVVAHGEVTEFAQFDGLSWWERALDGVVETVGRALDRVGEFLRDESSGGAGLGAGLSWVEREEMRRADRDFELGDMELG